MEKKVCEIKVSRDTESKEDIYIEYSFNEVKSRKRFMLSNDRDIKKCNKEIIQNILRNTILEITSNKKFWNEFADIVPMLDKQNKLERKERDKHNHTI